MIFFGLSVEIWLDLEPCIVSYSDIFYDSQAVESLMEDNSELAVTYDPNWLELWTSRFGDPLLDAETFRMDENSFLTEIGNKPVPLRRSRVNTWAS